mmetsp:Transcript_9900/g.12865  ORF Transcript_9900/g.12865 Transcript_9900/m.12865 type:complete len:602 (-) Transcript_9900:61-1866(-)|eukprot:CAMPEP_0116053686 /NCGR_PEP_ID=MMETSP0322-20121206/2348_1 /TAXON_ID=163516 /ORGANISM="Leptocylindrus danicus var. apora, Strain B651" /LENGTH=601 /DNA_ID=CAMNT_0003536923 /DNA_START=143 /DNA_END=1948 /DNA_ORIENTATION=-
MQCLGDAGIPSHNCNVMEQIVEDEVMENSSVEVSYNGIPPQEQGQQHSDENGNSSVKYMSKIELEEGKEGKEGATPKQEEDDNSSQSVFTDFVSDEVKEEIAEGTPSLQSNGNVVTSQIPLQYLDTALTVEQSEKDEVVDKNANFVSDPAVSFSFVNKKVAVRGSDEKARSDERAAKPETVGNSNDKIESRSDATVIVSSIPGNLNVAVGRPKSKENVEMNQGNTISVERESDVGKMKYVSNDVAAYSSILANQKLAIGQGSQGDGMVDGRQKGTESVEMKNVDYKTDAVSNTTASGRLMSATQSDGRLNKNQRSAAVFFTMVAKELSSQSSSTTGHLPIGCLNIIRANPGNSHCVDCNSEGPAMASVQHGTLLCESCAQRHEVYVRRSKIKPLVQSALIAEVDRWTCTEILCMLEGGNKQASDFLDQHQHGKILIAAGSSRDVVSNWPSRQKQNSERRFNLLKTTKMNFPSDSTRSIDSRSTDGNIPPRLRRYRTKAAKFYRSQLASHVESIKQSGFYRGKELTNVDDFNCGGSIGSMSQRSKTSFVPPVMVRKKTSRLLRIPSFGEKKNDDEQKSMREEKPKSKRKVMFRGLKKFSTSK